MANLERDAGYLRRIGEYKRRSHEEALQEHLALSLHERMKRGWEISLASAVVWQARDDDPTPFYDRARALGLYIP